MYKTNNLFISINKGGFCPNIRGIGEKSPTFVQNNFISRCGLFFGRLEEKEKNPFVVKMLKRKHADHIFFYESNSNKPANLALRACVKVFIFKKSQ